MSQQAQIDVSYPNILSWERDHYVVGTRSYAKGTRSYVVGTRYLCHGNDKILSRENKIKKIICPLCAAVPMACAIYVSVCLF